MPYAQGEENLKKAVAMQPVSVGICAGPTLMFYAGGVLDKVRWAGRVHARPLCACVCVCFCACTQDEGL